MRKIVLCGALTLLGLPATPHAEIVPDVSVVRHGDAFNVVATAHIEGDPQIVWNTLTDYEGLPRFVPGIHRVRIHERQRQDSGERLLVEQAGELRFLFYVRRVVVRLDVLHTPPLRVEARAVTDIDPALNADSDASGYRSFEATYVLEPMAGGVRLGYRARIEPSFSLLPWLGTLAVRNMVTTQFAAMLQEIELRQRAAGGVAR
jgi:Polyketide cyclase / dehydrase and lipid transport